MTDLQRKLLNLVQRDFPLERRPYRALGDRLGISEEECIEALRELSFQGILRAIKPVIAWKELGFSSVLVGAEVEEEFLDSVAGRVNRHPGVTHNYRRKGPLNLWFTLTYEGEDTGKSFLDEIRGLRGVRRLREFPAEKTYKIGLMLDV